MVASSSYLLGIDQGTTQTTALVVDEQGVMVVQNSVQLPVHFPAPGRVEQDPWDILESVRAAVGPLIAEYPITAVGFDNQGETFILLSGLAALHWQTDVRDALFGLNRGTTAADIARATLEGVAFRVYEVATAMLRAAPKPPSRLKVDGGPSANPYLMQFLADLLELEIHVAAVQEATAMGVANLAAHAVSGISLEELASHWQKKAVYAPQMKTEQREAYLERWQRAVNSLKFFHHPPQTAA